MPIQKLRPTFTFDQDRIAQLRAIAPEAFADGKINWDVLKEALGESLEEDSPNAEHFGLFWPGKREARRFASKPSSGTLIPARGEGVDEETTHNIFIEGDNLEVLKLLQKSYAGAVRMIYIDPPYNTGSDRIYTDNYVDPLEEYLTHSGQANEEGDLLTTNPKSEGRFHSKWLNMIYPRLRLARNLLREDGVIYVSIDNNEVHNLRLIMDDVLGPENFLGCVVRATGTTTGQDSRGFGSSFDYLLAYSKNAGYEIGGLPLSAEDAARFSEEDEKGKYSILQLRKTGTADRREDRPLMYFPVIAPDGTETYPIGPTGYESRWRVGRSTYEQMVTDNLIVWKQMQKDGEKRWVPYVKYYLEGREKRPSPLWDDLDGNKKATIEVKELLGDKVFDNPKPTALIIRLLQLATDNDTEDIVLDFFAGAATTGDGVFRMNQLDTGNRRFILVQLPASIEVNKEAAKLGFKTIADLSEERLRKTSEQQKADGATGDLGFRVFKLAPSNFKPWRDYDGQDLAALETQFAQFETPLIDGWTRENLLTEILLQQGFPLDSTLTPQKEFTKNEIVTVASPASAHKIFVCLDEKIQDATIKQLKLAKRDVFICLDSALSSEAKVRLGDATNLVVV